MFLFGLVVNPAIAVNAGSEPIWEVVSSKVCGNKLCSEVEITRETVSDSRSILYPKDQAKKGIPIENIVCLEGLHLMLKSSDGTPACVTKITMQHLIERGWGIEFIHTSD